MEDRNLDKALEITSKLLTGEEISRTGQNLGLYEEYSQNYEVYDILSKTLKKMNLNLYEYNNSLFVSAGENNRVFGFSNEELKRIMGLRLNKELFMTYFIMFNIITEFYKDSGAGTFTEYIRIEDAIRAVTSSLTNVLDKSQGIVLDEIEENSFKTLSLLWDELPSVSSEDKNGVRAARNSRSGYVKLTFNFLISQGLFTEMAERYYPTDRFKALAENYYEENRGRLYEIINGKEEMTDATD